MEGTIVVDGVLASCFASCDHDVANLGFIPIRWYPKVFQWIFGEDIMSPVFVIIAEEFGRWVTQYELPY